MTSFSCSRESYNTCRVKYCKKTSLSGHPVAVVELIRGRVDMYDGLNSMQVFYFYFFN